jgi:enediyne core biosynthesis thioesterase
MNAPGRPWIEYRHLVTFEDTNAVGSIYFAKYFSLQGECREKLLAQFYPEFVDDVRRGFCLVTESAHQDFFGEASLFDTLVIRVTVTTLTRSRIEFEFEYTRETDGRLLARGRQAVIWTNEHRRPALMPDKLYLATASFFHITEKI